MRTVLPDPLPSPVAEWLERRRALGQDLHDEVWDGEYHVAPAPRASHGDVDDQVATLLRPFARAVDLWPCGPLNIGNEGDYRVPDRAYLRQRTDEVFVTSAAVVVEITSPGDDSYRKFEFYTSSGVEEILVVDPRTRGVQWYARGDSGMERVGRSRLLALGEAELAESIDWPPVEG